jgi:hypothetical protein
VLQLEASLHETLLRVAQHSLGDQDPGHRRYCMPGFQTGLADGPAGPRAKFRAPPHASRA